MTQKSVGMTEHFQSRVFCPRIGIPEDHATGSAHCLLGPYWTNALGIKCGESLKARQLSERGGEMEVIWDQDKCVAHLRGDATIVSRGTLYF